MDVGGYISRGYEGVRDAFATAQAADEGGGQLCVYRHGQKVLDLWAGRDKINDRPYGEDTLTHHHVVHQGRDGSRRWSIASPSAALSTTRLPVADYLAGVRRRRQSRCAHLAPDEPLGGIAGSGRG